MREIKGKERPILFSTPMVQAILEGKKTQTRRIIKPQPSECDHTSFVDADWKNTGFTPSRISIKYGRLYCANCGAGTERSKDYGGQMCPYGKTGDILWVRESWRFAGGYEKKPDTRVMSPADFIYRADEEWSGPFKPSIHMPRNACRIFLEITDIRVERLHDISEEGAIAEGIEDLTGGQKLSFRNYINGHPMTPVGSFKSLWKKINGEENWNQNPWVWVIEFKPIKSIQ